MEGVWCLVGGFCRYPTPREEILDSKGTPETCESKHLEVPSAHCDIKDRDTCMNVLCEQQTPKGG